MCDFALYDLASSYFAYLAIGPEQELIRCLMITVGCALENLCIVLLCGNWFLLILLHAHPEIYLSLNYCYFRC